MLKLFGADTEGGLAVLAAIVLPMLCMCAAGAVELAEVVRTKSQLQVIVDSAAMGGARELMADQSGATTERARLTADAMAEAVRARWSVTTRAQADAKRGAITVSQDATRPSFFGSLLPPGGFHVAASATATANSLLPLCVLGLKGSGPDVVALGGSASLTANGCLVQSDGDLTAGGGTTVRAGASRAVGAASGNIVPAALTDAPAVADPFRALPITVPALCTDTLTQLPFLSTPIEPGVHCGGIQLLGNATLNLRPGEHYFKGGQLSLSGNATITGSDVVLIFENKAAADFGGSATLSLEGRKSGPYAGFVLVTDRSYTGTFTIATKNAKKLLGTVYLPNATLAVSGQGNKVADQSAWTVVVANRIAISESANLTINANYQSATVPVPTGVGPLGVRITN